jgi:Spy/CpxP family protein refolding chaperone
MRTVFIAAALSLFSITASAQEGRDAAGNTLQVQPTGHHCPMPEMAAVQTLGLTDEQLASVREIHAECELDCARSMKASGTVDQAAMARYQARVQAVLNPEQYERYRLLGAERKVKPTREVKGGVREAN